MERDVVPPEHVTLADDHPIHRALKELDDSLELRFNHKLQRYEVWNLSGFIQRVVGPDGTGYAEPGDWLLPKVKSFGARWVGALAAVRNAAAIVDQHNLEREVKKQMALDKHAEEVIEEHLPILRRALYDDPLIDKPFTTGGKQDASEENRSQEQGA